MHMDAIAARRTQAGEPVVHGIHTVLWGLESLIEAGILKSSIARMEVKFLKWIYLGDEAVLTLPRGEAADPRVFRVEVLGMPVLTAALSYGESPVVEGEDAASTSPLAPLSSCRERSLENLQNCEGVAYTARADDAGILFPHLTAFLTGTTVAELAACSYIVGMEAPGLHSMFSRLDVTLRKSAFTARGLHYRVDSLDERFRKARIAVTGSGVQGTLEVFVRFPPVLQASIEEAAKRVSPNEFAGMKALVIGGSRGLGELTAKLIAAGGGVPAISYAVGKPEAENVAGQIRQWGGEASILQYDVRKKPEPQLMGLTGITHLFYFATNAIFRPKGPLVSEPILTDFITFYLQGFHDLCVQLLKREGRTLVAYYPSSVAVEERPAGMTEYAMVKAAGEQMCVDMSQYLPNLRILMTRLPRLRTDQTAGYVPEREQDPIDVMLPIVRQMQGMRTER